jgi:hypothetical protein
VRATFFAALRHSAKFLGIRPQQLFIELTL